MHKQYEEIIERQRVIWRTNRTGMEAVDCFEEELKQLGVRPVQTPPEPPQDTWLTRLRDRLQNRTPYTERYAGDRPSVADIDPNRRKDLHDVMRHATLAEVEVALEEQQRYANELYYAHEAAMELLSDMRTIKRGTAGF